MACPRCDAEPIGFAVPDEWRADAPEGDAAAAICPRCLAVGTADAFGADPGADPAFSRIHGRFPRGDGGVAFALLVGKLPSLAVERAAVERLRAAAEAAGVDVALALDRLAEAPGVDPWFDLDRRAAQADALLE